MIADRVPVWIYAGPLAGKVRILIRDDADRAEREGFGEILKSGRISHQRQHGPHPAAEAFAAEIEAHGYLDREMRAREPAPVAPPAPAPDEIPKKKRGRPSKTR